MKKKEACFFKPCLTQVQAAIKTNKKTELTCIFSNKKKQYKKSFVIKPFCCLIIDKVQNIPKLQSKLNGGIKF